MLTLVAFAGARNRCAASPDSQARCSFMQMRGDRTPQFDLHDREQNNTSTRYTGDHEWTSSSDRSQLAIPVQIRTLDPHFTAAGYRFASEKQNVAEEDWPWLRLPSKSNNLCKNCSRINFHWLFTEALSGYPVTVGTLSAKLSDGICLGLYKDVSSRSHCDFCQLIVHALEYGADIELLNQYDDWPQKEIWVNNHFYDAKESVVMVPVADGLKRIPRIGNQAQMTTSCLCMEAARS